MQKYINRVTKHFKNKKIKNFFYKQIELYSQELRKNRKECKYIVGDQVIFNNDILLYGSRIKIDELELISDNGLISSDFYGDINLNKKKSWVVEFFKINETISLKEYIKKYCGCTIEVKNREGKTIKNIISDFDEVEKNIKSIKDIVYRDYIIYQNMEQRFLPNDYTNNATLAFIISCENKNHRELINYNVLDRNNDLQIQKNLFAKWFIKRYFLNKSFDNYETDRGVAYLFGIPSNMIEGIIVNREIEKNIDNLNKIKLLFPMCYICNIDGIVIK